MTVDVPPVIEHVDAYTELLRSCDRILAALINATILWITEGRSAGGRTVGITQSWGVFNRGRKKLGSYVRRGADQRTMAQIDLPPGKGFLEVRRHPLPKHATVEDLLWRDTMRPELFEVLVRFLVAIKFVAADVATGAADDYWDHFIQWEEVRRLVLRERRRSGAIVLPIAICGGPGEYRLLQAHGTWGASGHHGLNGAFVWMQFPNDLLSLGTGRGSGCIEAFEETALLMLPQEERAALQGFSFTTIQAASSDQDAVVQVVLPSAGNSFTGRGINRDTVLAAAIAWTNALNLRHRQMNGSTT